MQVGELLSNSARRSPDTTAIVAGDERYTFAQLDQRCGRLAGALLARGLKPGDRVGILFYNTPRFVESYFACMRAGLVATPVNFRLVGPEMAYILQDSGAKALLYGRDFAGTIAEIAGQLPGLQFMVTPQPDGSTPAEDYRAFLEGGSYAACDLSMGEGQPCQLMYTSGTTGRPKGAVLTHSNVFWNLHNTIWGREDRDGQVSIIVGPLFHTAALNNHLTIQVALGGTSILIRRFEPEMLLRIIEQERATVISGAPTMYNLLLQHPKAYDYDRSSIIKCTLGSAKLATETKRRLIEFFPNISGLYDVYGCTECSPCITVLNQADSLRKNGSVGRALPFLTARVVDSKDRPLPPGEVGELTCKGPNVMAGYHNQPEATRQSLIDGWFHTGDLARVDEEGFFYIVDRSKDMIVSGGENIYPREIEEVLFTHPAVADAAVVGVPDPLWGESVLAFVAVRAGQSLSEDEVIAYCKQRLASYKKPRQVRFLPEIPRNPSGKVLKYKLREMG
ncbi:MAG: long-chain fatty acid--CoA ligase [Thermodesulfobacteriota bacterium]